MKYPVIVVLLCSAIMDLECQILANKHVLFYS